MKTIINIIKMVLLTLKTYGLKVTIKKCVHALRFGMAVPIAASEHDYEYWIKNNEPDAVALAAQRKTVFDYAPKISVVVPMYNTPEPFFKELVESLQQQTYPNWELCLADGSPETDAALVPYYEGNDKIKYQHLQSNDGISENTNRGFEMATGDFIGLLDHDDTLAPFALYEVVKCINEHPEARFIYSDEDKIKGKDNERFDAFFKPDFAPNTLRSQNYICHFSVFKKELMDKLGGERKAFDGAQDFDLVLRMSEIAKENEIYHIPKILYHWRISETSTASSGDAKPWAFQAGTRAVQDHLDRIGRKGTVTDGYALGTYEVEYELLSRPKVSIVIPNKDGVETLEVCLKSILDRTTYDNYEINIIENNSEKEDTFAYYERIQEHEKINVFTYPDKGFNYSRIINFGVRNSSGEYIVQLNNDIEVITDDWIEKMLGYCQQEDVGAVGIKLLYPDYTVQHAGVLLGMGGIAGHYFKYIKDTDYGYFSKAVVIQDITAVTAACIMTTKAMYDEVGFMNEELAVAFNDIDFCMKIRKAGYHIIYHPYVKMLHYESKTRGEETTPEKVKRFNDEIDKFNALWHDEMQKGDPYYNINLRLDNDQCAIKTVEVQQ